MTILLYGLDTYRRNRKLRELLAAFEAKHEHADLMAVDLAETPEDWTRARDFVLQPSLFSDAKALVVRESGALDDAAWRKFLKAHREDERFFLLVSDERKPTKPFAFLAEPPAQVQEFPRLEGRLLEAFVTREAAGRNLTLSPEARRRLFAYFAQQPDPSWCAVMELEKLSLAGFSTPVSLSDCESLLPGGAEEDIPPSVGGLAGSGSLGGRIALLERLFAAGVPPAKIFNSLVYQVQGSQTLRLADLDVSVKSGGLEYEEALLDFVLGK